MVADSGQLLLAHAVEQLSLSVAASGDRLDAPITGAQVSDLLSYVMANGRRGNLWITIQAHPNIVAVAELTGLSGILVAGGIDPEEETVTRAEEEAIPLLTSPKSSFALAGELYQLGAR